MARDRQVLAGVANRDQRDVLRKAQEAGCVVSITNGNHVRVDTPQGPVFSGLTSGSPRTARNLETALRRKGVTL